VIKISSRTGMQEILDSAEGLWVHHVQLGLHLQEAMNALGLECTVQSPDQQRGDNYTGVIDFLTKKLTAVSIP